jgi:HK97 family phage prohead protease
MDHLFFNLEDLEIKADGKEAGWFKGYASTFGNVDQQKDMVLPEAFNQTIAEHTKAGTMPAMYFNHNPMEQVGDWLSMEVNKKGLVVEGQLWINSNIPRADQSYKMLNSKTGKGLSIGFNHITPPIYDSKKGIRMLTQLGLDEISIASRPVNKSAKIVSIKSLLEENKILTVRDTENWLRDAVGLSSNEAKSFIAAFKSGLQSERDASEEGTSILDAALGNLKALRIQNNLPAK